MAKGLSQGQAQCDPETKRRPLAAGRPKPTQAGQPGASRSQRQSSAPCLPGGLLLALTLHLASFQDKRHSLQGLPSGSESLGVPCWGHSPFPTCSWEDFLPT